MHVKKSRTHLVLTVAFLAGACTMTVELAAVRVLAPWFGTSSSVWTNVIGVVLLALSIGYLIGARASRSPRPRRALSRALFVAAVCAAALPFASAYVARWFLPEGLTLGEAGDLVRWGSLASGACLFLPPALALGCVAPLCAEILERDTIARGDRASAGRAGGAVLCVGTLGSLLGTFGTTYAFVPALGLSRTFAGAAIVLAVLGLLVTFVGRERDEAQASDGARASSREAIGAGLAALVAVGAALLAPRGGGPSLGTDMVLVDARESAVQSVRVVETLGEPPRLRFLQVNESFDSFQSVWQERAGFLPDGFYYNHFVFPLWWSHAIGTYRILVVGMGAGSAWRVMEGARPTALSIDMVGAEIDPVVTELAQRHMDLPPAHPRCRVFAPLDGRAAVRASREPLDMIVLDAYANQMEIPAHLSSVEFFDECREHLISGGWLCANVGGFGLDDPVVDAVASSLARAFGRRVLALRVPFSRNVTLYVRRDGDPYEPLGPGWATGDADVDRRLSAASLPGMWRWFEPTEGRVLTDDTNPIQELQRRSVETASAESVP